MNTKIRTQVTTQPTVVNGIIPAQIRKVQCLDENGAVIFTLQEVSTDKLDLVFLAMKQGCLAAVKSITAAEDRAISELVNLLLNNLYSDGEKDFDNFDWACGPSKSKLIIWDTDKPYSAGNFKEKELDQALYQLGFIRKDYPEPDIIGNAPPFAQFRHSEFAIINPKTEEERQALKDKLMSQTIQVTFSL